MFRSFPGGVFTAKSEGRLYRRLRDPEIVSGVEAREADIGFLGSDKFEEWRPGLAVDWVGVVEGCDFVLAAAAGTVGDVQSKLRQGETVRTVTGNPGWLGQFAAMNGWQLDTREVTGSAEAFGDMADMVADLRVSGRSLLDNGLEEFRILDSVKLGLIYTGTEGSP